MIISSYKGEYSAEFFKDFSFLGKIAEYSNKFFIFDKSVYELYGDKLAALTDNSPFYLVEAIEENKDIEQVLKIMDEVVGLKSKRNTVIVAIGGGITQDISAFLSNIIYRGVKWIYVPTTLLAQTDSCIGSKTSLNYKHYKNLLGYFYPPSEIFIDTEFLTTLSDKDYLSGLGEIVKCAIMDGAESFKSTANNIKQLLLRSPDVALKEIKKALNFKKSVIEKDEFDTDYRNIMNYGHTFGHALESTSDYEVPHGQGVSFGILIANEISLNRGYISNDLKSEMEECIKKIVMPELIKKSYFNNTGYINAIKNDKKYTGGLLTAILFKENGVKRFSDISESEINNAVNAVLHSVTEG